MTLVGYWPLNEESGDTAYDHSGNSNSGSLNGGVTQGTTGLLGENAYSFDGTDDNINLGSSNKLTEGLETGFTFSSWIKTDSSQNQRIIDNDYSENSFYFMLLDGALVLALNGSNWQDVQSTMNPADGNWHHVIGRFDGSKIELYIDGEKDGELSDVSANFYQNNIHIGVKGQDLPNTYTQPFNGKISEVRIYDRPLTRREIQYLYTVGKRGLQTTSKITS